MNCAAENPRPDSTAAQLFFGASPASLHSLNDDSMDTCILAALCSSAMGNSSQGIQPGQAAGAPQPDLKPAPQKKQLRSGLSHLCQKHLPATREIYSAGLYRRSGAMQGRSLNCTFPLDMHHRPKHAACPESFAR